MYSNKLGFLGGVSWALLVAKVCQLYPKRSAASLVCLFFVFLDTWDWQNPVSLNKIQPVAGKKLNMQVSL